MPGISRVVAPVAMIRLSQVSCSVPPSLVLTSIDFGAGEGAPAVDLGDLVLLHQEVHALDDALGHRAAAGVRGAEVHRRVAGDPELVLLVGQDVRQLRVAQQGLGRDAADVEADTAPVLVLHDGDALAELGGADGGDVPTGAGTEDDDVVVRAHAAEPRGCRVGDHEDGAEISPTSTGPFVSCGS